MIETKASADAAGDFSEALKDIWSVTSGDPNVCVAVLDGPADLLHDCFRGTSLAELSGNTWRATRSVASNHGTSVASIIFGRANGPIRGLSSNCRGIVVPIFLEEPESIGPTCSQSELAAAIRVAVGAGAHIINISAGEPAKNSSVDPLLEAALEECSSEGVLVIAAAGDDGCCMPEIPSSHNTVLAVAMSPRSANQCSATSPDSNKLNCLAAPGSDIPAALLGGGTVRVSGTSYAAALVSGLAALLLSLCTESGLAIRPREVGQVLLDSARVYGQQGLRHVDARAAHQLVKQLVATCRQRVASPEIQKPAAPNTIYVVPPSVLKNKFKLEKLADFGTVRVRLPDETSYSVPDFHYPVDGGSGMVLIPVCEDGNGTTSEGSSPNGGDTSLLDEHLRRAMGLSVEEPIYAILSYIHPDENDYPVAVLPYTAKLQLGHRHVGAYLGSGRTTHALARSDRWRGSGPLAMALNVDRHPATVHTVSMTGVPQAVLNKNAHIVDTIITSGMRVPQNADDTTSMRAIDLTTTLQYYRDVIRGAEYLEELPWFTNCSAHKLIVLNVMLNVPHNPNAFGQIFGEDGPALWADLGSRYEAVTGQAFRSEDQTDFVPLWWLCGLDQGLVQPLPLGEYNAFHAARLEGRLAGYRGRRPLDDTRGLAWPLETLVDLIERFMSTYIPFASVGGVVCCAEILILREPLTRRGRINEKVYLEAMSPLVAKLMVADALTRGDEAEIWLRRAAQEILHWVADHDPRYKPDQEGVLATVLDHATAIAHGEWIRQQSASRDRRTDAVEWLRVALIPELETLRVAFSPPGGWDRRFASPSVFHQVACGTHPCSPFVQVRTIGTVMDHRDVIPQDAHGPMAWTAAAAEEHTVDHYSRSKVAMRVTTADDSLGSESVQTARRPASTLQPAAAEPGTFLIGSSVYALGQVGYDFPSRSRRDSLRQILRGGSSPEDPASMLVHLEENPHDAAALQWYLGVDGVPLYLLAPEGAFARDTYGLLRRFLHEQLTEGVERVSIPGTITGQGRHRSGLTLPIIAPEQRGMYSWTTTALVASAAAAASERSADGEANIQVEGAVANFLERVYFELRNAGNAPHERALNFAATNAFEVEKVYERAIREDMELDTIEVTASPLVPPGADCWDVKLVFFFPERPTQGGRRVFRFTVDVADVVPAIVGPMRSWSIR